MTDIVTTQQTDMRGDWTPVGWKAPDDLTHNEWIAMGPQLGGVAKALHFWIGDWLNAGEYKWGEMYAQAMDSTDFEYRTLSRDTWVCRAVPLELRRSELSFTHHWHVAALDAERQRDLLDQAVTDGWNTRQLKEEVQKLTALPEPEQPQLQFSDDGHDEFYQLGEQIGHALIEAIEPREVEIIRAILNPAPDEDKFKSNDWCDGCQEEAERQYKYLRGWKRYTHRLEKEVEQLKAELDTPIVIDHTPTRHDLRAGMAKI